MGEAIAITSGKGGVGKSSTVINIATLLAQRGFTVCMIDMDLGLKNLDIMLGLEHRVIFDLKDVLDGRCTLAKAIIKDKREENLYLLPACKTIHIDQFPKHELPHIVEALKQKFDFVLLDAPAGIESGFLQAIACVKKTIVVTTLDVTALQDADRVIGILMKEGMEEISFIVNRMQPRLIEKGICITLEEAKSWLAVDFLGYVFEDEEMIRANNHGTPLTRRKDSQLYSCFHCIVKRLLCETSALPKYRSKTILAKLFV